MQSLISALFEGLLVHRLAGLLPALLSIALLAACSSFLAVPQPSSPIPAWMGTYVENQSQTLVDFGQANAAAREHSFIQACESMLDMGRPSAGTKWTVNGQTIREFPTAPSAAILGARVIVAADGSPTIEFVDHPIGEQVAGGKCPKEAAGS